MAEFVTFVALDQDDVALGVCSVTVFNLSAAVEVNDTFGPAVPGVGLRVTTLVAGTYRANVRSNGYKFPLFFEFNVPVGSGPSANEPLVVEIPGESSARPNTVFPCRVYGWVRRPSPNSTPGGELQAHGSTYNDGPTVYSVTVAWTVWFNLVNPREAGEMRSLMTKARTRVSVDSNGFFEALLEPDSTYAVSLPNVAGVRYIATPASGEEADIETLVNASASASLSELA